MPEVYSDEVKNLMQQAGFTQEDIEMLEALKKMEEGIGLGVEGHGIAIDLNPIRL